MSKFLELPRNYLILGDNLESLQKIPKESVDLIYLDPQYNSAQDYLSVDNKGQATGFSDIWIGGPETYKKFMLPRLDIMKYVLKPAGSIFLHCDQTENYELRKILDNIFGRNQFVNELIWCYFKPGNTSKRFQRSHDTIYWYSKTNDYFNAIENVRFKYAESTKKTNEGKKFKEGQSWSNQEYKLHPGGKLPPDWWMIGQAHLSKKQYIRFKTQKPEELLRIIIEAASPVGGIVVDPFMGSGTTCVVAYRNDRYFIGMDLTVTSISLTKARLDKEHMIENFRLQDYKKDYKVERQWFSYDLLRYGLDPKKEFEPLMIEKFCEKYNKVGEHLPTNTPSIDGFFKDPVSGVTDGVIQVKQMDQIGLGDVAKFKGGFDVERRNRGVNWGVLISFDFSSQHTQNAYSFAAGEELHDSSIKLQLIKVDELVNISKKPDLLLKKNEDEIKAEVVMNDENRKIVTFIWIIEDKINKIERKDKKKKSVVQEPKTMICFNRSGIFNPYKIKTEDENKKELKLDPGEYKITCRATDDTCEFAEESIDITVEARDNKQEENTEVTSAGEEDTFIDIDEEDEDGILRF